jgi:hypothetical protein
MKKRNESGRGERAAAFFPDGGTVTAADRHERAAHDSGTGARGRGTHSRICLHGKSRERWRRQ